jgi:hypothetical protein
LGRKKNSDSNLVDIIKEPYGKISFSRLSGFILILHYIFFSSYMMIKEGKIPDLPTNHLILIASLYGINKIALRIQDVVKNIVSK